MNVRRRAGTPLRHSLRGRLVAAVLLLGALLIVLATYQVRDEFAQAEELTIERARGITAVVAATQANLVEAIREPLVSIARSLREATDPEACSAFMVQTHTIFPSYGNFGVADVGGDVWCSAVSLTESVDFSDRAWFEEALRTGGLVVSDFVVDRTTRVPSLTISYRVDDGDGVPRGVVFTSVELARLTRLAEGAPLPPGSVVTVIDANGVVLAHLPEMEGLVGQPAEERAWLREVAEGRAEGAIAQVGADGVRRFHVYSPMSPLTPDTFVSVGVPVDVAYARATAHLRRNLAILALIVGATLAAVWFGTERFFLRKVDELVALAARLGGGDLTARSALDAERSEFGQLARSFNEMSRALQVKTETLEHLAFHDVLTGLPNRSLFYDRVEQAIVQSTRTGRPFAVMLIDLDDFKRINDEHGHDVGDAFLRETASAIRSCVRKADTVARLGGDEFVVVVVDLDTHAAAEPIAATILERLRRPVVVDGLVLDTTASIGIETYPGRATTREDLLKNADVALYCAKGAGKDGAAFAPRGLSPSAG